MMKQLFKPQLLFFILFVTAFSYAQKTVDYNQLDEYISKAVKDFNIPGMAVGIIKNGEIVFAKGYGYGNVETKEPVTPETVFGIASLTKAFTAACIGMLAD